MSIITLTTDWGSGDPYVAAFKGDLLRRDPSVRIEHISHDIPKYDLLSAAFFAVSTFHHFPKGTVHFLGMESGGGHKPFEPAEYLIARFQEHFFVGADSGIFHMIFQDQPFDCWKLEIDAGISLKELFSRLADTVVA